MKKTAAIAFIVSLLLYSCDQNKPPSNHIPIVGEAIDSVAIANDTVQQENIEGSYEYAQTVIVSPKLAYDVRAYGGPASQGEYCIIRRGADNKPDTVVQNTRIGIIKNVFTGDLNRNGLEEIYIVMKSPNANGPSSFEAFEFDDKGKASALSLDRSNNAVLLRSEQKNIGNDSIYINNGMLVISWPGNESYSYKLVGTKLTLVSNP